MGKVMLTITLDDQGSLESAAQRLGLSPKDLDQSFGVVEIDPAQHLYAVLVDEKRAEQASSREGVSGPYSNPPIEPFGTPRKWPPDPQPAISVFRSIERCSPP